MARGYTWHSVRAYRPDSASLLTVLQRMLLLACMVGLILGGIFYWLAVLSVARSVSNTVSGVGDTLAAPVQVTTIPRQGANFKKSPLDSEALSSPEALLGPGIVGEGRSGPGFELPTAGP